MGNDRKECEFQAEMTKFFGSNPKIVSAATVSYMAMESGTADHSDDEDEELPRNATKKEKAKVVKITRFQDDRVSEGI